MQFLMMSQLKCTLTNLQQSLRKTPEVLLLETNLPDNPKTFRQNSTKSRKLHKLNTFSSSAAIVMIKLGNIAVVVLYHLWSMVGSNTKLALEMVIQKQFLR